MYAFRGCPRSAESLPTIAGMRIQAQGIRDNALGIDGKTMKQVIDDIGCQMHAGLSTPLPELVKGEWLGMPQQGVYCDDCGKPHPGVAVALLRRISRVRSQR